MKQIKSLNFGVKITSSKSATCKNNFSFIQISTQDFPKTGFYK